MFMLPPPQPMPIPTRAAKRTTPSIVRQLRRRAGIPKKRSMARADPPAIVKNLSKGRFNLALFAPVVTVSMEVTADAPVTSAVVGFRVHPTPVVVLDTAQVRATFPVNPFDGVTVIVEVPELGCVTVIEPLFVRAKVGAGGAVTVIVTVAVAVGTPVDIPVTVAV